MGVLHRVAEGGQTWAHRMRMVRQVVKIAFLGALVAGLSVGVIGMLRLDPLLYQGSWYHWKAQLIEPWTKEMTVDPAIWRQLSRTYSSKNQVAPTKVIKATEPYYELCYSEGIRHLKRGGVAAISTVVLILGFFLVRGGLSGKKEHLAGRQIVPVRKLAWRLRLKRQASDIWVGELPLVKNTETQHLLVTGGTGSGKTNCFHHLIPQIEERGDRMIILDVTGSLVDRYYQEGDALLNPMDPRGLPWHPWAEGQTPMDFASIAEGFIPVSHSDNENYWRTAARSVVSALLKEGAQEQKTSGLFKMLINHLLLWAV